MSTALFDESRPYRDDVELYRRLGFDANVTFHHATEHRLGLYEKTYDDGDGESSWTVEVFITAMPAQFYRFIVNTIEGKRYNITTGSGTLRKYWPFVEEVGNGMIEMEAA